MPLYWVGPILVYGGLLVSTLLFFFGVWLAITERRDMRRRMFSALVITTGAWFFCFSMWRMAADASTALIWARSIHVIGCCMPAAFLALAITSLPGNKLVRWYWPSVGLVFAASVWLCYGWRGGIALLGTGLVATGLHRTAMASLFAVLFVAALLILVVANRRRHGPEEGGPITALIIGGVIALNAVFNVLYSFGANFNSIDYGWAALTLLAGDFVMAIFLLKRRLLVDLRFIGMEIVIMLALLILMTDIVSTAESAVEFYFRLSVLILLGIYGVLATRAMVHDAKQLKQNEQLREQLIKTNGQLIEADRFKTKFVSFVAHQLRTPVSGVYIYMDMIRQGRFGRVSKELVDIVNTNLDVLNRLAITIDTFLDLAKIEHGNIQMFKSENDVGALVLRVAQETRSLAEHKGLALKVGFAPQSLSAVFDNSLIYHAFFNLTDNAIKYTEHGSVTVSALKKGDWIEFTVHDTGAGLQDSDRERLFKIFERGVTAVRLESKGAGLGLFIVKQFVETHGGQIFFDSPGPGLGSIFGFRIPFERA